MEETWRWGYFNCYLKSFYDTESRSDAAANWRTDWLTDWLTHRLTDKETDWLTVSVWVSRVISWRKSYRSASHLPVNILILPSKTCFYLFVCLFTCLSGSDPATYELIQKVQMLQKKLISKTEEVVEKSLVLQDKDKLYAGKNCHHRLPRLIYTLV
jgi:hypothetical protein